VAGSVTAAVRSDPECDESLSQCSMTLRMTRETFLMDTDLRSAGVQDGLVVVVKSSCETCQTVVPVLADLADRADLTVYTQDDPAFPVVADWVFDDTDLATSWRLDLETVPTLLRIADGIEADRVVGWDRDRWEEVARVDGLGPDLPPFRPG